MGSFHVFSSSHRPMKTLSEITHLAHSTSDCKVVHISKMVRRVMVGCGGEGREFFHASDLNFFYFFSLKTTDLEAAGNSYPPSPHVE